MVTFSAEIAKIVYRIHGGGTGVYPSFFYGGTVPGRGDVYPYNVICGERPVLSVNCQYR